jgi:hypothetical protein
MPFFLSITMHRVLTFPAHDHNVISFLCLLMSSLLAWEDRLICLIKTIEDVESWDMLCLCMVLCRF